MTSTNYYYHERKIPRAISEYVTIGTGFDLEKDEALTRKRPIAIEEMTVRDSQGRRRFHGAYTGGFSAGYFNSCGSEEGWTPKTFRSSRTDKSAMNDFKPEDFMDDEDLSEYGIAPRRLVPKEGYQMSSSSLTENIKNKINQSSVSYHNADSLASLLGGNGTASFDDSKISYNDSIGIKLLKNIGWKEGRGVGELHPISRAFEPSDKPKVYGCALPPKLGTNNKSIDKDTTNQIFILPTDAHIKMPDIRTNLHGLGYVPIRGLKELAIKKDDFKPTGMEKIGIRGQAFGTGVINDIEDDDDEIPSNYLDIYAEDTMDNYDYSLDATTKHHQTNVSSCDNLKFVPSTKKLVLSQYMYNLPRIPADYVPKPSLGEEIVRASSSNNLNDHPNKQPKRIIDPLTKSMMLGDISAEEFIQRRCQSSTTIKPTINLVEKLGLNIQMKKFVKSGQDGISTGFVDDISNSDKSQQIFTHMEKLDIERQAKIPGNLVSRRTISPWLPEKLLSRRFNVPYVELDVGFNGMDTAEKTFIYKGKSGGLEFTQDESYSMKNIDTKLMITPSINKFNSAIYTDYVLDSKNDINKDTNLINKQIEHETDKRQSDKTDNIDILIPVEQPAVKPSIDLFKAIFANESDQE